MANSYVTVNITSQRKTIIAATGNGLYIKKNSRNIKFNFDFAY